ncbi:MAG TPA: type II and III secretion system protein [Cytophagaceae bacterium]|jgi:type IV pilus assembly protein PilQ|nr:type II and III secretion system protein [Cytophagaceae bacterium]
MDFIKLNAWAIRVALLLMLQLYSIQLFSQNTPKPDRFELLAEKLDDLKKDVPGLNEKVDFAISGASIQEFIKTLAESNNLNVSVDPMLSFKVHNNFTNEKVSTILLFLCKEYDLDIRFVGTIMSFYKYVPPTEIKLATPPKEIKAAYNNYSKLITLDLKNDTLEQVAKKITQVTKKNIILSSGLGGKLVSAYIEDAPLDNALKKMAYANNLKVVKTEDDFYVIRSPEEGEDLLVEKNNRKRPAPKPLTSVGTSTNGQQPGNGNGSGTTAASLFTDVIDSLGQKRITIEAVNASIVDIIKNVAQLTGDGYFIFSDVKGHATTAVYNVLFDEFLTYLLQGTEYTYKKDQGIYLIGDRKLEGLRASRVVQLQYRSVDKMMEMIPAEIKKNVETKEFKELNSILLTGSVPQIAEIEAFMKELDRVVPMVMIEVLLLDVRKNRTIKTGLSAGLGDSSVTTKGTFLPSVDMTLSSSTINDFLSFIGTNNSVNLGRVTPKFYASISALEDNSNVEVRSMPKLSTLNGHDANLSIGSTRYYFVETQNTLGTLTTTTIRTRQWNPVQASLDINIKPLVSGDDQVTLEIDVSISDFLDSPDPTAPPPASNSKFKSMIRVKNEEMIALGGIERIEKNKQGSGVPILSRIPVLKWLFSSRTNSRNKVVSVVFIKPIIIY